jgi:hypothetical protein
MVGKVGRRIEIYRKQVEGEIGERKRYFWNTYSRLHNTVVSEDLRIWNAVSELPPANRWKREISVELRHSLCLPLFILDPELVPDYCLVKALMWNHKSHTDAPILLECQINASTLRSDISNILNTHKGNNVAQSPKSSRRARCAKHADYQVSSEAGRQQELCGL